MILEKNKEILKNASKLSFFILLNKPIGFLRDILQARYFGLGILSDAYIIAWRIPNVFRRIFGEGLLNNVLLPDLIKIEKREGMQQVNKVVSLILIVIQIIITIICFIIAYKSRAIVTLLSPGALDRISCSAEMLEILSFFTFFMSFSSILGISVQLHKNFYIGPQSQFILNIIFCCQLYYGKLYQWSYMTMSGLIVFNGFIVLFVHLLTFFYYNFYFCQPDKKSLQYTFIFLKKFFTALLGNLLLESNSFFGLSISSYLPAGRLSLFELLLTIIRLPQQAFGSSVASTMNVDIIHAINENNDEAKKIPGMVYPVFMLFFYISLFISMSIYIFSDLFFTLFFYLSNISEIFIPQSGHLLLIMSLSLFPAFINRILLNIYYAKEKIMLTTGITFLVSIFYTFFISYTINHYQLYALAIGYCLSDWMRSIIFSLILYKKYNIIFIDKKQIMCIKKELIRVIFYFVLFKSYEYIIYFFIVNMFLFKNEIISFLAILLSIISYYVFNKIYMIK
jgi:putative peptidoglycan lipid II flippase